MYLRQSEGVYIHISEWHQYAKEYTIPNGKRVQAIKMGNTYCLNEFTYKNGKKIPNKSYIPEYLKCYKIEWEWVKVPNGVTWFHTSKFYATYESKTVNHPILQRQSYDYQDKAIRELTARTVGLLHASTWSGKTQIIADITMRLHRNTLIVVQNLTQMSQMVNDIHNILGVIPTQVSGKVVSAKKKAEWYPHITVCSIDSRDKINPHDYGLILLDEADCYLGSDDRREWVGNLSPEYMYALTGTVKINNVDDSVFRLYYGPTTELKMLHLTPKYVQVYSEFRYILDDMSKFHELKAELYGDQERNRMIIDLAVKTSNELRKGIVFTEHVEHAKVLADAISARWIKTFMLIGEVKDQDRERIRQEAKDHDGPVCIVWSVKILGRGFDLPELSYGILTTCEKFTSNIQQYIGRIIRAHPTKPEPVFYDITDNLQYLLKNQARSRKETFTRTFPDWKTFIW